MKNIIATILFLLLLFGNTQVFSQYYNPKSADSTKNAAEIKAPPAPVEKKGWDWNKVYPGGNAWINFRPFFIEISPLAGYWITNWFTSGMMLTYIYFNTNLSLQNPSTGI